MTTGPYCTYCASWYNGRYANQMPRMQASLGGCSSYYLKTAPSAPSSHSPAAVDAKCRFLTLHPHLIIASLPIPFSHKTYNIYIPRFICVNIQTQKRQQGSLLMCMLQIGKLSWVNENTLSGLFFFKETRLSVKYAKDWLDQSFLFSGLVWSGKGFHIWMLSRGAFNNPVY